MESRNLKDKNMYRYLIREVINNITKEKPTRKRRSGKETEVDKETLRDCNLIIQQHLSYLKFNKQPLTPERIFKKASQFLPYMYYLLKSSRRKFDTSSIQYQSQTFTPQFIYPL